MLSGWLVRILSIHDIWQLGFAWVAMEIVGINPVHSTLPSKDCLFFPLLNRLMLKSPITITFSLDLNPDSSFRIVSLNFNISPEGGR